MNNRLLLSGCVILVLLTACGTSADDNVVVITGTPSPTSTPRLTDTAIPTDTPVPPDTPVILTADGFRIVYTGSLEAQAGGTLEVTFQVFGPDDQPAQGTFFATLGDPPSDSRASHANGPLDPEGKITLMLNVNWPVGITKLYCGFQDQVYEVSEIVINP